MMWKSLLLVAGTMFTCAASADVLYGAQVVKVYAQSRAESDAHLIMINQTLSSVCNSNRLYIEINDKELFATALASYMSGRTVDLIFTTTADPKSAAGHLAGIRCKVLSIF
jgi:hypothetical protein